MDDSAYMPMDQDNSKDGESCGSKTWRFVKKSFLAIILIGLIGVLVIQFITIAAITDVSADGTITQIDAQEYIQEQIDDIVADDDAAVDETVADDTEVVEEETDVVAPADETEVVAEEEVVVVDPVAVI